MTKNFLLKLHYSNFSKLKDFDIYFPSFINLGMWTKSMEVFWWKKNTRKQKEKNEVKTKTWVQKNVCQKDDIWKDISQKSLMMHEKTLVIRQGVTQVGLAELVKLDSGWYNGHFYQRYRCMAYTSTFFLGIFAILPLSLWGWCNSFHFIMLNFDSIISSYVQLSSADLQPKSFTVTFTNLWFKKWETIFLLH